MNRARTVTASVVAAIGTVAAAGVLLFAGSGPAAGSTVPTAPVVIYYTPVPPKPIPTAILDEFHCNEISCTPVFHYFGR